MIGCFDCTLQHAAMSAVEQQKGADSPLQVKLINFLGLDNYFITRFVFRRKNCSYRILQREDENFLVVLPQHSDPKSIKEQQFYPPYGFSFLVTIIETVGHSIPVAKLRPLNFHPDNTTTIIYVHGNSSDLVDSLCFMSKMSQMYTAEYIMFDYTGYGVSRLSTVGEEIICEDMKIVLAWADRPLNKVILWGFSLGTYPIVNIAAQFPVRALLLQSPIGSVSCMFYKNYDVDIKFKQDYFASINHIANVKAKNIMILHSDSDEIIPLKQAKLLYDKYVRKHGDARIDFIEVEGIKHNSMNKYISAISQNSLQKEVLLFLNECADRGKKEKRGMKISDDKFDTSLSEIRQEIIEVDKIYY